MAKSSDFSKEWPKIKKQLMKFSDDAMKMAKKGEKELVRLSSEGKLRLDATTLGLKKEQLYYLIGKEFVKKGGDLSKNIKLKKLLAEFRNTNKELRALNRKIKVKKS